MDFSSLLSFLKETSRNTATASNGGGVSSGTDLTVATSEIKENFAKNPGGLGSGAYYVGTFNGADHVTSDLQVHDNTPAADQLYDAA